MSSRRLSFSQITDIRKRVAQGEKQRTLAQEYGVTSPYISMIVRDKARPRDMDKQQCLDCGKPIHVSRKRCEQCVPKNMRTYLHEYHLKTYTPKRPRYQRRYRTEQGGFVIDKLTNEKHGPYTYNHARYLTARWNKRWIAS